MKSEEIQFIAIALAIIAGASGWRYIVKSAKHFIQNSIKTTAKVVAIKKVKTDRGISFELSVIFNDQLGKEVNAQVSGGSAKNKEGDEVEVLYLKTDSSKVKIGTFPKTISDLSNILRVAIAGLTIILFYMLYSGMAQIPSF